MSDFVGGTSAYTLGDLIAEGELALDLVSGDDTSWGREVAGIQVVENEAPGRFLQCGWVMLTTGLKAPETGAAARRMLAELDKVGATALGFGLQIVHKSVPAELLSAARKKGFPLFTVPPQTAFPTIVTTVFSNVLSDDFRSFARLAFIQRYLLDSLAHEQPKETIARRLAEVTKTSVAVISEDGTVEAGADDIAWADLLPERNLNAPSATHRFHAHGLSGLVVPIESGPAERLFLVVAARDVTAMSATIEAAAKTAASVVSALGVLDQTHRAHEKAVRKATLELLLESRTIEEGLIASARASACGVELAAGVQLLAVGHPLGEDVLRACLDGIEARLASSHIPFLAAIYDGFGSVALPADVKDELIDENFLQLDADLRVGVGRVVTAASSVSSSWDDAKLALRTRGRRITGRLTRYDDLDLGSVLFNELPFERLRPKIEGWLTPLRENPLAYETLASYFQHDLDIGKTARSLGLHPNSIRYRLSRVEEVIGVPLSSISTIVGVHIALLADNRDPPSQLPPNAASDD